MSNFGSNPKIFKSENENNNFVKQKKKMKKKKKKTTDIKIQTILEQSANISPIVVGSCPTTSDPVKGSFVQELPKHEVYMFFVLNLIIYLCRNKNTL